MSIYLKIILTIIFGTIFIMISRVLIKMAYLDVPFIAPMPGIVMLFVIAFGIVGVWMV